MRTKDKLAAVLKEAGLDFMAGQAAAGRYDDFEAECATPILLLVLELEKVGRPDLANRARNGEWDATKEEAEEWFQREGKDLIP